MATTVNTCTTCHDRPAAHCQQCVAEAQSWAAEAATTSIERSVLEVFTGLDDCAVEVPDAWHEKPVCRIQHLRDDGDASVGLQSRSTWALADNQEGTVLADILAAQNGPAIAWIRFCSDGTCEGPIHDSRMDDLRRRSGAWTPLVIAPDHRAFQNGGMRHDACQG